MKKINFLLGSLVAAVTMGCATNSSAVVAPTSESMAVMAGATSESTSVSGFVGGWAPAFFSEFNKKELQEIVTGIQEGRISKVVVSYPTQMNKLAVQIHDYLQSVTKGNIQMEAYELANTDTVTYNMSQVVVTMYFGSGK